MSRFAPLAALAVLLASPAAVAGPKAPHKDELRSDTSSVRDAAVPEAELQAGGQVVLAVLGEPDSFNPYLSTTADVDAMLRLVFPTLMHEAPEYAKEPPTFSPYLAERWETSADGRSITFHLRKDAVWSDGVPITAEDVRYSWETAKSADVAWVNNSIKDFIDDVRVVDPKTCVLHYTETYPYQVMDANDGYVIPKHVFGKIPYKDWKTKASWLAEGGVAGGPYRLVGYKPQQQVEFEANPRYHRAGYPKIPRVVFRIIKNQPAQLDALLSGGIDVLESVKPIDVRRVLDTGQFRLFNCLSRSYTYVGWNCKRFPFDDPGVRRAMTLGIDREDIVESLLLGYGEVSCSAIISSMWAHDRSLKPWPYDPEEAERTLASRGWKRGGDGVQAKDGKRLSFAIVTNAENQQRVKACTKMQANLEEIGVEVRIEQVEFNQMAERCRKHDFDAYYGGWNVATKVDEKPAFHSASRGYDGFNWVDYENKRVDELIDTTRIMSDFAKAKPNWDEFQRILHEEQPYTFVSEPRQLNVYRKTIRNVLSAAVTPYYNLEEWTLSDAGK
jgi:peptide/nickel transport system substrate-binding protein